MNRLRDVVEREGGLRGDPLFREGVELLRKTPPTPAMPDAQARVWRALRRAPASPSRRRGFQGWMMKLAVAGAVALVAGTAGAVIAHRWTLPRLGGAAPPAAPKSAAPRAPSGPRAEGAAAVAPVASIDDAAAQSQAVKPPVRSAPRKAARGPLSAAAVARERTEVLDALIALRREHDAVRAGALLGRYLAVHPQGALREEALVLAIEAADARGDRAAGAQLARAYQQEFPEGRFLSFARSHTAH
jgi:hypothetical protein